MSLNEPPPIDTHAHIFRADLPMDRATALYLPDYDFTSEDYLKALDAHGVRQACIAAPSFLATYNDYMIACLRAHRDRLRGTAIVEPGIDPYSLRAMDADGVVGIRLSFRARGALPDLAGAEWQRLFWRLADLSWHVHLHVEGARLPELLPVLTAAPMALVIDHFGRPDPADAVNSPGFRALLGAFDTGRTWGKLSGGYRLGCDAGPLARRLMEVAGPERLVWGSDCPFAGHEREISYADTLADYLRWVPDPADRATIAEATRRLYRFS